MNERFEGLAKAIFEHECSGPESPAASWDEQNERCKKRYRVAAMVTRLITLGPIYQMDMLPVAEPPNTPYPSPTGPQEPESAKALAG